MIFDDGRWWIHHKVFRVSKETLRIVRDKLDQVNAVMGQLWVMSPPEASKTHTRYLALMGWVPHGEEENADGKICKTFTRETRGKR